MKLLAKRSVPVRFGVVAVLLCIWVSRAPAQPDPNLPPTFGAVTLKARFKNDPHTKSLVAGGQIKTKLGGVTAHIAKAPDYRLNYETDGKLPLTFHVKSPGDTTLLINLPDGTWIADDDSGGGLDPLVRITKPKPGRYDIYVGTYNKEPVAATLFITELDPTKKKPPLVPPKDNLPDCFIVSAGVDNYPFIGKLKGDINDARNVLAAFKAQEGTIFRSVKTHKTQALLDGSATRDSILEGFKSFTTQGKNSDFMVLFLSGHGGRANKNKSWYYCPFDFHPDKYGATALSDKQILQVADQLAKQKKYVIIIVDACFSGQMQATAQPFLKRFDKANEGGLVLMLSSAADQTSTALGNYSAFAKAFADGMAGGADLKKNGKITLGNIRTYIKKRTAELLAEARLTNQQDCMVVWSPSISEDTPLASAGKPAMEFAKLTPAGDATKWVGSETLPGFGKLTFTTYPNGVAIMMDARSKTEGIWQQHGNHMTLAFANGAIVYTGALKGATLSGTATSPNSREQGARSWTWKVTKQ
jgi:hypothetical protein